MNWIQKIRECFEINSVLYTRHAKLEMDNEEYGRIFDVDVYQTVCNGEMIEEYPNDKPYPSILIFGKTETGRPLHLVCAYDEEDDSAIIITVYQPDPNMWIEFKKRKQI